MDAQWRIQGPYCIVWQPNTMLLRWHAVSRLSIGLTPAHGRQQTWRQDVQLDVCVCRKLNEVAESSHATKTRRFGMPARTVRAPNTSHTTACIDCVSGPRAACASATSGVVCIGVGGVFGRRIRRTLKPQTGEVLQFGVWWLACPPARPNFVAR